MAEDPTEALDWRPLPDIAELTGLSLSDLRQLIRDGKVVAQRRGERELLCLPAEQFDSSGVVKHLTAVLTVLRDGGYDDLAALRWLATADDSLPGTPLEQLRADRGTEVKRRAQAAGF